MLTSPPGRLADPRRQPTIRGDRRLAIAIAKSHRAVARSVVDGTLDGTYTVAHSRTRIYSNLRLREKFGWPLTGVLHFDEDTPGW